MSQAYVLETVDKWWVAEKVTEGTRNISNNLSIGATLDKVWCVSGFFFFARLAECIV